MRHIALLFEFATLNGGERSMLSVIDRLLEKRGYTFTVIAPGSGHLAEECLERDIPHLALDIRDGNGRRLPRETILDRLHECVQHSTCDLLHANSLSMGRLTGAVATRLNVPTVAHLRDILKLSHAAVDHLNRNKWMVAVSQATLEYHAAQGLAEDKVDVIYNGVDGHRFCPRPSTGFLKRELGLPDDAFLIATIGQIGLRKGQLVLAEAAVALKERLRNAHYLLVGERMSNKEESVQFEQRIRDCFTEAGMSDRLHMLGYRNDVPQILNEIDLLVHPAKQEPLGRVLLEAAASEVPIVATNVGGTAEILTDGHSARLVPPGDSASLAEAILEMHNDGDKRRKFASNGRRYVQHEFYIGRAATELAELWNDLVG